LALSVPLSRFTPRVGGGSAFYVRHHCVMESKKPRLPDEGLAKFCIIAGWAMVVLPLFLSHDTGLKLRAAGAGFMGLSWGHSQVAAAKKWRQKYGEPSTEELIEVKKSHSVSWPIWALVALVVFGIVFAALTGAKHEH